MSDTFDVRFGFRAEATGKMRNEVRVTSTVPAASGTYEIATDESPMFGGDASAPTPLHYFVAALAGCLMTQVRAFAPRLGVPLDALVVEGTASWLATVTADSLIGPSQSRSSLTCTSTALPRRRTSGHLLRRRSAGASWSRRLPKASRGGTTSTMGS